MATRVVTKVGDVFQTKDGRLLQLVAIDRLDLSSDVVVVYSDKVKQISDITLGEIEFYHHTTVSAGVKQGLWDKIGKAEIPDCSKFIFKTYIDDISAKIISTVRPRRFGLKPQAYWRVWRPTDMAVKTFRLSKGKRLTAEEGGITPPTDILFRIKNKKSSFKTRWPQ